MTLPSAIQSLIVLFRPHCTDTATLDQLHRVIDDRSSWIKSRNLFDTIRLKNIAAARRSDRIAEAQYCFEETCAKTLYNLTLKPAPYDPDTPYWIIPTALALAAKLDISALAVVDIVALTK